MKGFIVFFTCCSTFQTLTAQVKLPQTIRDSMVLQRYSPIEVWGWSSPEEKITVTFNGERASTIASTDGNCIVSFTKMKEGGPYSMKINGKMK